MNFKFEAARKKSNQQIQETEKELLALRKALQVHKVKDSKFVYDHIGNFMCETCNEIVVKSGGDLQE